MFHRQKKMTFLSSTFVLAIFLLASTSSKILDDDDEDRRSSSANDSSVTSSSNDDHLPRCTSGNVDLSKCPSGVKCRDLGVECLAWCHCPSICEYGKESEAQCNVHESIQCEGEPTFSKPFTCQYCYQAPVDKMTCEEKFDCDAVADPNKRNYVANCTVSDQVMCLGRRQFLKQEQCNWTGGLKWTTALALSITLGGFGADR